MTIFKGNSQDVAFTLTLMPMVVILVNIVMQKKLKKITETPSNGYSSVSTQGELSNEYQHNRVLDGFRNILHLSAMWRKLSQHGQRVSQP